jgi:hypothetical protein
MKWFAVAAVSAAVVAVAVVALRPVAETDEDQIRAVITSGQKALEAADVKGALAVLDDDYADGGGRKKDAMKGITFMALRRGPVIIAISDAKIDVAPGASVATAVVTGIALQGAASVVEAKDLLPTRGRAFEATISFVKGDAEWRITRIDGISASFLDG